MIPQTDQIKAHSDRPGDVCLDSPSETPTNPALYRVDDPDQMSELFVGADIRFVPIQRGFSGYQSIVELGQLTITENVFHTTIVAEAVVDPASALLVLVNESPEQAPHNGRSTRRGDVIVYGPGATHHEYGRGQQTLSLILPAAEFERQLAALLPTEHPTLDGRRYWAHMLCAPVAELSEAEHQRHTFLTSQTQWLPFMRAGYADDGGTLVERTISVGAGYSLNEEGDYLGLGVNWGRPDKQSTGDDAEDQYLLETYYRWQALDHPQLVPSLQYIVDPAYNPEEDSLWVFAVRMRATF
jgi:hypothetical protein